MANGFSRKICWRLELPEWYFSDIADKGLLLGNRSDYPEHYEFLGNWDIYRDPSFEKEIVHTELIIINSEGTKK